MEISCLEVIRELSSYVDNGLDPTLRAQIAEHLPGCAHCTAVYDGLRNTVMLLGDGGAFEPPSGFSQPHPYGLRKSDRVKQKRYQAWQVINTAQDQLCALNARFWFRKAWKNPTRSFSPVPYCFQVKSLPGHSHGHISFDCGNGQVDFRTRV